MSAIAYLDQSDSADTAAPGTFDAYQRSVRWRAIPYLTPRQRVEEEADRLEPARLEYDNREPGRRRSP